MSRIIRGSARLLRKTKGRGELGNRAPRERRRNRQLSARPIPSGSPRVHVSSGPIAKPLRNGAAARILGASAALAHELRHAHARAEPMLRVGQPSRRRGLFCDNCARSRPNDGPAPLSCDARRWEAAGERASRDFLEVKAASLWFIRVRPVLEIVRLRSVIGLCRFRRMQRDPLCGFPPAAGCDPGFGRKYACLLLRCGFRSAMKSARLKARICAVASDCERVLNVTAPLT